MAADEIRGSMFAVEEDDTMAAYGKLRTNLALHHLFAACRFTARILQLERENKGKPFGEFWDEILHNALGVLTLSTAALETFANELYFEGNGLKDTFNNKTAEILGDLIDRQPVLSKYELILAARTSNSLSYGTPVVQNVQLLIELRNQVIHFRPEWDGEDGKHAKLSKRLNHRFAPSPYLTGENLFPRAWASGAFASWALNSTIVFIDSFCADSRVSNPFEQIRDRLTEYSAGAV